MARGLLSCGALAALLLVVAGCNPPASTTNERPTPRSAQTTAKQEGTAPANTLKEPGHIPGG